eukprot:4781904-Alexandrium_andersonii.AAC.1
MCIRDRCHSLPPALCLFSRPAARVRRRARSSEAPGLAQDRLIRGSRELSTFKRTTCLTTRAGVRKGLHSS